MCKKKKERKKMQRCQCNAKHREKGVESLDIGTYLTAEKESTSEEKQPKPPANSEDKRESLYDII